jgi:hypothetical protein
MGWVGYGRRRTHTVLPTDVFVFAFLALGVSAGSRVVTGNEVAVVALTIAWMSAAITRLGELRRGERPALQLQQLNVRTSAILIAGTVPWILMGVLQRAYPAWIIWKPIAVTPALQALGIALSMAVIAEPFLNSMRKPETRPRDAYRFSEPVMIRSGAILLLSGSPVFALLCALWLGITIWRPAAFPSS